MCKCIKWRRNVYKNIGTCTVYGKVCSMCVGMKVRHLVHVYM